MKGFEYGATFDSWAKRSTIGNHMGRLGVPITASQPHGHTLSWDGPMKTSPKALPTGVAYMVGEGTVFPGTCKVRTLLLEPCF